VVRGEFSRLKEHAKIGNTQHSFWFGVGMMLAAFAGHREPFCFPVFLAR
jgi:hypothetical protein